MLMSNVSTRPANLWPAVDPAKACQMKVLEHGKRVANSHILKPSDEAVEGIEPGIRLG